MQLDKRTMQKLGLLVAGGIALFWLLENIGVVGKLVGIAWGIVFPFILGLIFAFILNLPMQAIENHLFKNRLPRAKRLLSFLITLFLLLLVLAFVIFLVVPQLVKTVEMLISAMPEYIKRIQDNLAPLEKYIPTLQDYLQKLDWNKLGSSLFSWAQSGFGDFFSSAVGVATSVVSGATSFIISIIFACYVLFDKEHMHAQVDSLFKAYMKPQRYAKVLDVAHLANRIFSRFVTGQCAEALAIGSVYIVILTVGGFDYALLIGVLIAFSSFIPILGAFIGCVLGAVLIMVSSGFWRGIAFVILFLVVQQLDGNFMYPRIVGTSIGLPPMWVLVAVTLGGGLMGVFGMLFFIPLTSVFYVLLRKDANRRMEEKGIPSPVDSYYLSKPKKTQKIKKKKKE